MQSCFSGVLAAVVETASGVLSQLKTRWALIGEFAKLPENMMLYISTLFLTYNYKLRVITYLNSVQRQEPIREGVSKENEGKLKLVR